DEHWDKFVDLFILALHERRSFARTLVSLFESSTEKEDLSDLQRHDLDLYSKQMQAMQNGSFRNGLKMFERLCKQKNLSPKAMSYAHAQHGIALAEHDKLEEALKELKKSIDFYPESAWIIASRGAIYKNIKLYEEAFNDLNRALEI